MMKCAGHAACTKQTRNAYKILLKKYQGKILHRKQNAVEMLPKKATKQFFFVVGGQVVVVLCDLVM
jgi:hypothetical protein